MGLLNPHLDDAAFAQVWTDRASGDGPSTQSAERHLASCAECRGRYTGFTEWLETLRADALTEAEAAVTPDRLVAQQTQIQRRLEALEHPARVLAFPRFARPISAQHTPRRRWVAAAAAAGLIVGVAVGQVFDFAASDSGPRQLPQQVAVRTLPSDAPGIVLRPISDAGDDVDLNYREAPSQVTVPESLQYLNAVTPLSRDYDPR